MKAPVKDRKTVPWMSTIEIPAVKLVLSEWRKMRRLGKWRNGLPYIGSVSLPKYVKDAAVLLQYVSVSESKLKAETER